MRRFQVLVALLVILVSCTTATSGPAPSSDGKAGSAKDTGAGAKAQDPADKPAAKAEVKFDKIKVAYTALSGGNAPLWVAQEKGIFKKYGLDVESIFVAGTSIAAQGLAAGELVGVTVAPNLVLDMTMAGTPTVLVTAASNQMVFSLYGVPSLTKPEDLKGKKVGVARFGSAGDVATRVSLSKFGLEPERDYAILQTGGPPESLAAMQAGGLDAGILSPPTTLKAKKLGMKELIDITALNIPFTQNGFAMTKDWLAKNEDIARRFVKGYVEGVALAKADKGYTKELIRQYTKTDDPEILEETYNIFIERVLDRAPYASLAGAQTAIDEAAVQDPRAKSYKPEQLVDWRFIKELEDSGFIKSLYDKK